MSLMDPKDLLHNVNNQFEVMLSATKLLHLRSPDAHTAELCSHIRLAVSNASSMLNAYMKERIATCPSGSDLAYSTNPVPASGLQKKIEFGK
jgi:hypothetical protein